MGNLMNQDDEAITQVAPTESNAFSQSKSFAGKYQILRTLGKGGMGTVFLAKDPVLERWVAIKTLHTDVAETFPGSEVSIRFEREAKAMATVQHPNIVAVHDAGWNDKQFYIVMEYVEGKTIQGKIASNGPFPMNEAVTIMIQACRGLAIIHQAGLVHRDIKPANILVKDDGTVKIMDFGIAHSFASDLTNTKQILGTPHYMSPEQIQSLKSVDQRSDIFSLGVVFYEMLTGEKAFPGKSFSASSWKIINETPVLPSKILALLPKNIDQIIQRCLAKSPKERYHSCVELANDLETILFPGPIRNLPPDPTPMPDDPHSAIFQDIKRFHNDTLTDPLLNGDTAFSLNLISIGISTFPTVYRAVSRQIAFINQIGPRLTSASDWVAFPLLSGWYRTGFLLYLIGVLGLLSEMVWLTINPGSVSFFWLHSEKIFVLYFFIFTQILMFFGMAILQFWYWTRAKQIDTMKRDWTNLFGAAWPESWRTGEEHLAVYAHTLFQWTLISLIWMFCTQINIGLSLRVFINPQHLLALPQPIGAVALVGLVFAGVAMFAFMLVINNATIIRTQWFTVDKSRKVSSTFLAVAAWLNVVCWGLAFFLANMGGYLDALRYLTK